MLVSQPIACPHVGVASLLMSTAHILQLFWAPNYESIYGYLIQIWEGEKYAKSMTSKKQKRSNEKMNELRKENANLFVYSFCPFDET